MHDFFTAFSAAPSQRAIGSKMEIVCFDRFHFTANPGSPLLGFAGLLLSPTKVTSMNRLVLALAASLALATSASAQTFTKSPAQVEAGAYAIDASHTRVMFGVSHMGFSTWYGEFPSATGSLTLDPKTPANSKLEVTVQTASLTTTNTKLDDELRSADWLDATKYPTITFTSKSVKVTSPGKAEVVGDLTLHGVTRPVTLTASFNGAGPNPLSKAYTTGFEVSGKIKRSDFGVKTYIPVIGDEVDLIISAAFEKQK